MARSHPSTNCTLRPLFLEARVRVPKEKEETNLLGIINTLLALQEPKKLIGWLGQNTEENTTKLIKFIVAVKDEYDKLVVNYNQLLASKDQDNTREEENQGVIRYLQGQVADLTAKNNTFRRLQEQAIVNPLLQVKHLYLSRDTHLLLAHLAIMELATPTRPVRVLQPSRPTHLQRSVASRERTDRSSQMVRMACQSNIGWLKWTEK